MQCLSCGQQVDGSSVRLVSEVLVCPKCEDMVSRFTKDVMRDLQLLDRYSKEAIRLGLIEGDFAARPIGETPMVRIITLVNLVSRVCLSTPASSTPALPSGESSPQNAALAALRKSSSSPTE